MNIFLEYIRTPLIFKKSHLWLGKNLLMDLEIVENQIGLQKIALFIVDKITLLF
jgi:hypothetical protein